MTASRILVRPGALTLATPRPANHDEGALLTKELVDAIEARRQAQADWQRAVTSLAMGNGSQAEVRRRRLRVELLFGFQLDAVARGCEGLGRSIAAKQARAREMKR